MPTDKTHHRGLVIALSLALVALSAGISVGATISWTPKGKAEATRTLLFPSDQVMGNLSLEPESGLEWVPENVLLRSEWEYFGAARGEVVVPGGRRVKLDVQLALAPRDAARFQAKNPRGYEVLVADRLRRDPNDLSGLSALDPNALFWLSVDSAVRPEMGALPGTYEAIGRLVGLEMLSLRNVDVTDAGVERLASLPLLRGLELTEASITPRGLAALKQLPALEYLFLDTGATDADLEAVAHVSSLRWLRLGNGTFWGSGLAELARLPHLERLCLMSTKPLFDRHVAHLEGLTQLKGLTFWGGGDTLTDASLASISRLENLEELYFIRANPRFTSAGVAKLKGLRHLRVIDFGQAWSGLAGPRFGDRIVGHLAALPDLESVRRIEALSYNGMQAVAKLSGLKCLHVTLMDRRQGYRGRTGLSQLAGLTQLEDLAISCGDPLSAADLAHLESLTHLKRLLIMAPSIPDEGLASIGKLRELEHVELLCQVSGQGLNQLNELSNLRSLNVSAFAPMGTRVPAGEGGLDLSGLVRLENLTLSGLPMHADDLAFLRRLPTLKDVMIQPISPVPSAALRHLTGLPELNRLWISELTDCVGADLASLNSLPKLRHVTLSGQITGSALAFLTGPASLSSLHVTTDDPIQRDIVAELTARHPAMEYIHINTLTPPPVRPTVVPRRPTSNRSAPANRRRRR